MLKRRIREWEWEWVSQENHSASGASAADLYSGGMEIMGEVHMFISKLCSIPLGLLFATAALAVAPAAQKAAPHAGAAQAQVKAYVDPETGKLVQAPALVDKKDAASNEQFSSDESRVTRELTPQGRLYRLHGQANSSVVAHVGADGKLSYQCDEVAEHAVANSPEVRDER